MNDVQPKEPNEMHPVIRGLALFVLSCVCAFAIGFLQGHLQRSLELGRALTFASVARYAIAIAVIAGCCWGAFRLIKPLFKRGKNNQPLRSTRTGRNRLMWLAMIPLSIFIALAFGILDINIFKPAKAGAAVTPAIAIAALVAGLALFFFLDRFYRRNVDEMELNAVFEASYWAINFYWLAMPIGWLLWKAKLLASMPSWPIFWIAMLIYNLTFLWKKFR